MSHFHFLRPLWLLAFVPIALLAWRLWRRSDIAASWRGVVEPHLLKHLLVGEKQQSRLTPLSLLVVGWCVGVIALAGPTWQRVPAPFADDSAVLAIVVKISPSMKTQDVQPTRLARAIEKIQDLLDARPGAKTSLIAYSGSAHRVMPLTSDAGIINQFAAELAPEIMPVEGDAAGKALALADETVAKSGQRGWILWIADSLAPDQAGALKEYAQQQRTPVGILAVVGAGPEYDSLFTAAKDLGADLVNVTPDDTDVKHLAANSRYSMAADGTGERWCDVGYWFVPLLAATCCFWSRRGWLISEGAAR